MTISALPVSFFVPIEQKIKEDYGDQVSIVTKHFPLSMHPYAHVASRSAEAARKQGKYKEMHDKIFEGQELWSKGSASAYLSVMQRKLVWIQKCLPLI